MNTRKILGLHYDYILRWICKKLIIQGRFHDAIVTALYQIIREAAAEEFTEDNVPTLNGFLEDCFEIPNQEAICEVNNKYPILSKNCIEELKKYINWDSNSQDHKLSGDFIAAFNDMIKRLRWEKNPTESKIS